MTKPATPPAKPPHPSRLNALDLAKLNEANAVLGGCRVDLKCKLLEQRVLQLEHEQAVRSLRDEAHAAQARLVQAEASYQELAAQLAKAYGVSLKTSAIVPETGEITTLT